jgi:hypothetical protein
MQGYKVKEKTAIVPHCTPSFKTQWAPYIYNNVHCIVIIVVWSTTTYIVLWLLLSDPQQRTLYCDYCCLIHYFLKVSKVIFLSQSQQSSKWKFKFTDPNLEDWVSTILYRNLLLFCCCKCWHNIGRFNTDQEQSFIEDLNLYWYRQLFNIHIHTINNVCFI